MPCVESGCQDAEFCNHGGRPVRVPGLAADSEAVVMRLLSRPMVMLACKGFFASLRMAE